MEKDNQKKSTIKKIFAKLGVKYTVTICLILIFSLMFAFDYFWSKTYEVEIVSVSNYTPYADQSERVEITVKVTHFGKPMVGHSMFALQDAGRMMNYTDTTDENGLATFVYVPHEVSKFEPNPKLDVYIRIRDESNSIFWEVNAYNVVELNLKAGRKP